MENSAHTWRLKIFKLVFVYAHRLFCYPPAQKKFFARAKNFFLSPQSSGSRTGGYLLSCPTLCKHWRVDFLSQPPFFSNFSIPAALAAHRYSWTSMACYNTKGMKMDTIMSGLETRVCNFHFPQRCTARARLGEIIKLSSQSFCGFLAG